MGILPDRSWRTQDVDPEIAELQIITHLTNKGCQISIPFDEYRYDLIADANGTLLRIQVKKAREGEASRYRIPVGDYDESEVDMFAGYIIEEEKPFYVTSSETGENHFRVNMKNRSDIKPSNRGQANPIEEYTFDQVLSDWKNSQR
jgi:hypothetical protein